MNQTNTVSAPRTKTYEITITALMAAVTCILAPLSIPIGPVPISFTNLAIYLSLYLLGWKKGTISYLIYLLLGLVGLPVFSGFTGGPAKLAGPTGGYIIGFIAMAIIAGLVIDDLDIDMLRVLRYIDTVNTSLQVHLLFFGQVHMNAVQFLCEPEGQLIVIWLKASLLQMLL